MTTDKISLPEFFTILYFSDMFTSLIAVMLWSGFPKENLYMVGLVNSVLYWILFKTIMYLMIILVLKYLSNYSKYAENIVISVTVIYGIIVLNNLSNIAMMIPAFNITPEFYNSITQHQIEIIP